MTKRKILHDSGTKRIYHADSEDQLILVFNDNLPDGDNEAPVRVKGKGALNNSVSSQIFEYLESYNIFTHFISKISDKEMQVKNLDMLPLDILIYNGASRSLSRRYGFEEGNILSVPVIEFVYKAEELKNPLVNETHLGALELLTQEEIIFFNRMIAKTNAVLKSFFERRQLCLVELSLNIGRYKENLYIGDEISPDTCQFWGMNGDQEIDKGFYRRYKGKDDEAYKKIVERVSGSIPS